MIANCQAIIKVGKNKGKSCGRSECYIIGHGKYAEGKGKCRQIIPKGRNKGLMCGRIKCVLHHDIADYLELPLEFRNRGICIHGYDLFISYLEYESNKLDIKFVIKNLLSVTDKKDPLIKELIVIIIFQILDTNAGINLRLKHKKFRNIVDQKLIEFQNPKCNTSDSFKKYITTFETGKTYLCKKKNILRKLKIYTLYTGYLLQIFKQVQEKRNTKSLCIIS